MDFPLIQVELGVDGQGTQRLLAIFGAPGGTMVYVRLPLLRWDWEEVLRQSLEASRCTMEGKS